MAENPGSLSPSRCTSGGQQKNRVCWRPLAIRLRLLLARAARHGRLRCACTALPARSPAPTRCARNLQQLFPFTSQRWACPLGASSRRSSESPTELNACLPSHLDASDSHVSLLPALTVTSLTNLSYYCYRSTLPPRATLPNSASASASTSQMTS